MDTKEVMVTAPVIVFLYDRTFVAGGFVEAWLRRRGYYLALAATWLPLAWLLLGRGGGRGVAAGFGLGVSGWSYLLKQAEAIVLYLRLSIWPHPLVLDYGTAVADRATEVWWQMPIVLGLLAATMFALVKKPAAGFLGAWLFLILAPSSSVVPLVTQTMAEHRMYLPLAAVIAGGVLCIHSRLLQIRSASSRTPSFPCSLAPFLPALLALPLGVLTAARNRDYRDALTLWGDTVAKCPTSARAQNNLAVALQNAGRFESADRHYARAVALQPDYATAHYDWGVALLDQGRQGDAIAQLETAVRLAPGFPDAEVNLGKALLLANRAPEAIPHLEAALRSQPAADAHYLLGVALIEVGRTAEAATELQAALRLSPAVAGAHRELGLLRARAGRLAEAAGEFRELIRLTPADADAHANLGNVLLLQGDAAGAAAQFEEALRLRPGDDRLRASLQSARDALGR